MSFWKAKTKVRWNDKLFSEWVRTRANWHCEVKVGCSGAKDFRAEPQALTCAHIFGRSCEALRMDPDNAVAACRPCHNYIEEEPGKSWFMGWAERRAGAQTWGALLMKKQRGKKRDDYLDRLVLRQMLRDQKAEYAKAKKA